MLKSSKVLMGVAGLILALTALSVEAATITAIDFKGGKSGADSSQIVITADGPLSVDKQENPTDKQIILEIKGAKLTKQT